MGAVKITITFTLTYIIDGNNLQHVLFRPASRGVAQADIDRRLIEHLSAWTGRQGRGRVTVEVYFDGSQAALPDLPGVKVHVAGAGRSADDEVLERARWHAFYQRPCVVVSNDVELRQAAQEAGAQVVSASDFASRPNALRLRRSYRPDGGPSSSTGSDAEFSPRARWQRAFEAARHSRPGGERAPRPARGAPRRPPGEAVTWTEAIRAAREAAGRGAGARSPGGEAPQSARAAGDPSEGPQSASGSDRDELHLARTERNQEAPDPTEGPRYRIDFGTWPLTAGRRFLIDSFCPLHRAEIADLLSAFDEASFTHHDLQALAEILLARCGREPDFVRGGSLMDRARRVLLLAGDRATALMTIARTTGRAPSELRRKLRQNEGKWVQRVPESVGGPSTNHATE